MATSRTGLGAGGVAGQSRQTLREMEVLAERSRRLARMAGLLHLSGDPLERLVRDAFNDMGLPAQATKPGDTYDVAVKIGDARLLIEVTGIDGSINKGSRRSPKCWTADNGRRQTATASVSP